MLENTEMEELIERYETLVQEYVSMAEELAPKLEAFGRVRNELVILTNEFSRRGAKVEDGEEILDRLKALKPAEETEE